MSKFAGILTAGFVFAACAAQAQLSKALAGGAQGGAAAAVGGSGPRATFTPADAAAGKPVAFEIKDFSFGVENPTTIGSATGGAGAGKIKFNEFTIKKTFDATSPAFFGHEAAGQHFKTVVITSGKVTFTLATVFIKSINYASGEAGQIQETISLVYGGLHMSNGGADAKGWNQATNKAWDTVTVAAGP